MSSPDAVPSKTYALAPMTGDLRAMTIVALLLPIVLGAAFFALPVPPSPADALLGPIKIGTLTFVVLTYLVVYFGFRPSRFEVHPGGLWIHWPLRARFIPKGAIESVSLVDRAAFRAEHGLGMRIGAGGLWGGFGLLKTARETFSMWISRTDAYVVVRLKNDRALLITPDAATDFLAHLRATLG